MLAELLKDMGVPSGASLFHSGGRMLTVLMPITRAWPREQVMAAIEASDIPRDLALLVYDAPEVGPWAEDFERLGFRVSVHETGNPMPPDSYLLGRDPARCARRERHREVRILTQSLVPDGPLLCTEDDTIVPYDVYSRLSAAGHSATGVQVGRHAVRQVGIRGAHAMTGVESIKSCGHYCLLTTGEVYRGAPIPVSGNVDTGHTAQIESLVVDWGCICGHLTEDEGVLWP